MDALPPLPLLALVSAWPLKGRSVPAQQGLTIHLP